MNGFVAIERSRKTRAAGPILLASALLLITAACHSLSRSDASPPPNIVLFYVDDMGARDAGYLGSEYYETPVLDGFAAESLVFTQAYSAGPNCAPSRAALLTGQYAPRTGVYTVNSSKRGKAKDRRLVPTPNRTDLPEDTITLAHCLREAGYATASVGKWHLGDDPGAFGFDVNVGGSAWGHPKKGYFPPYHLDALVDGPEGEYLTDRLTDEAIGFLEENAERPFFLYFPHYAVHTPIQCPDLDRDRFAEKAPSGAHDNAKYAGMLARVDESLERILATLDRLGVAENTIVVFHSDNGGHGGVTDNSPLRGAKGMLYEGGIRVPLAVRAPGRFAAGTCDEPVIGVDLFPTLLALAGAKAPADHPLDGESLVPLRRGSGELERDALFWHFPAYLEGKPTWRTTPVGAVRQGPLKLLEFFEDGRLELYDLDADPSETTNLAASRPDAAAKLLARMREWRREIGAPVPTEPEPAYESQAAPRPEGTRPNVILFLADDLGYGEVGCYGQEKIRTPHLDSLSEQGMRFTQHYAGSAVCAPSRCVLLTGRHAGHAWVRNNSPGHRRNNPHREGQTPLPAGTTTLATLLDDAGYATAAIGKWGLGGPGEEGEPHHQGFDHFFGYLCQAHAHNYYPTHLWRNGEKVAIENPVIEKPGKLTEAPEDFAAYQGVNYAPDLMIDEAEEFVRAHAAEPFFLYFASPVPHAALQVPDDSLRGYPEAWDEAPYLAETGYLPHPRPRAAYAAMVTRMDEHLGRLLALLDELHLADDTIVLFTSDNGPTYNGGTDSEFFASSAGLRGRKGNLFEGGLRVPLIARWPHAIPDGKVSDHPSAFCDLLPSVLEMVELEIPDGLDGTSFAPTLLHYRSAQPRADYLYWELGKSQALRVDDWKLIRNVDKKGETTAMLFDLATDPHEEHDLAESHPEELARLIEMIRAARTPSALFPAPWDDGR